MASPLSCSNQLGESSSWRPKDLSNLPVSRVCFGSRDAQGRAARNPYYDG
jgi:hypothetical protein